jgi:hypothetical protein
MIFIIRLLILTVLSYNIQFISSSSSSSAHSKCGGNCLNLGNCISHNSGISYFCQCPSGLFSNITD